MLIDADNCLRLQAEHRHHAALHSLPDTSQVRTSSSLVDSAFCPAFSLRGLQRRGNRVAWQHGNGSCFRNALLNGEPQRLVDAIPARGKLEFDFVSYRTVPPLCI